MDIINKIDSILRLREGKGNKDRKTPTPLTGKIATNFHNTIKSYAAKALKNYDKESERILDQIISRKDLTDLLDFIPINSEKVKDDIDRIMEKAGTSKTKESIWAVAIQLLSSPKKLEKYTKYDKRYLG